MPGDLHNFIRQFLLSIEKQLFIKITLSNKRQQSADLKNVFVRPVIIKNTPKLTFIYRYPTKDITKNFDTKESSILIAKMLEDEFYNADLFTTENDFHLSFKKNNTSFTGIKPATLTAGTFLQQHDKQKVRIVKTANNIYLKQLGITTAEGLVKKDMQDKYKQINRYIEIIDGIVKDLRFNSQIEVADMGSGKGYLTFALYDYLVNNLSLSATVTGIELRQELVEKCNGIALAAGFKNLIFKGGSIKDSVLPDIDILIALHACDTATDDAISTGIKAGAKVIICAPCCHKQIRKQMQPANEMKAITKHGILLERQAEIATDAIRALLLEAAGYKTSVFEFIATEHTPKNVMIAAIKSGKENEAAKTALDKAAALKSVFGIQSHYLETLLEKQE
jgi:tRNA A58 N-methylase Trm61